MSAPDGERSGGWVIARLLLAVVAVTDGVIGAWAAFAPRSFYDEFPGGGRAWVSVDGPFNEHLIRDFGSLNLALALMLAVAAVTMRPLLVKAVSAATVVYGVPHLVYHLRHLDVYETSDAVATVVSLSLAVAAPVLAFLLVRTARPSA